MLGLYFLSKMPDIPEFNINAFDESRVSHRRKSSGTAQKKRRKLERKTQDHKKKGSRSRR